MSKERSSLDEEVRLHLLNNGESSSQTSHNGDPEADYSPAYPTKRRIYGRKRISNKIICGGVVIGLFIALVIYASRSPHVRNVQWPKWPKWDDDAAESKELLSLYQDRSQYVAPVRGPHFRDNLLNNTKYVTASPIGGFSNEVMAQINLLYLAKLTNRIPVIFDFVPGHMHGNPGFLPVSLVYDLPRLAETLRMPILEWEDIKERESGVEDDIGCWSLHLTIWGPDFNTGGHFASEHQSSLDVSLWPVPDLRLSPGTNHLNLMAVASLSWPEARAEALKHSEVSPSKKKKHVLPPDEHLLCYDSLYYGATVKPYEWFERWNPMWTQIGTHLHWEPRMEALARGYIYGAFNLTETDPFPSYISVHIRHTDFANLCQGAPDCFPPLSVYDEKVQEVRAELLEKNDLHVDKVLVTSDEEDEAWWKTVDNYGWHRINWVAEKTEEKYSEWYPIVLDSIALSLGKGFVGTTRSTLSMLAARRVEDWEHGYTREVHLQSG